MIPEFKRPELEDKELIDYYFAQAQAEAAREHLRMYISGPDSIK